MVNDLLPDAANQTASTNPSIQKLLAIPFVVTEDLYAVTICQSFITPAEMCGGSAQQALRWLTALECCTGP